MKKIIALVMVGVILCALGSCGTADFDAKGYVEASLDAKFHREYEAYADIIGISKEEAKEQMENEFNESLKTAMNESGLKITEAEMEEYLKLEADIRAKVQYEVKGVKKDENDNFTVKVEITPVSAYTSLETVYRDKLVTAIQSGATQNEYMAVFLAAMKDCVTNAKTGETVTLTLNVKWQETDKQKVYSIDEEDWLNVDAVATGSLSR